MLPSKRPPNLDNQITKRVQLGKHTRLSSLKIGNTTNDELVAPMKRVLITLAALVVSLPCVAFNPTHLERLKRTNSCVGCDLRKVNLSTSNLRDANLRRTNLSGADLRYIYQAYNVVFDGANLNYANLEDSAFGWGSFVGANLVRANLRDGGYFRANFTNANITGANLSGASFQQANFTRANLANADLSNANLKNANLTGANLNGANFCRATLPDGRIWSQGC